MLLLPTVCWQGTTYWRENPSPLAALSKVSIRAVSSSAGPSASGTRNWLSESVVSEMRTSAMSPQNVRAPPPWNGWQPMASGRVPLSFQDFQLAYVMPPQQTPSMK